MMSIKLYCDIAILNIKVSDYCFITSLISKNEAIDLTLLGLVGRRIPPPPIKLF